MVKIMPHYQSSNTILSFFFFFFKKLSFKKICMHNSNEHAVKLRRLEILDLIKSIVLKH